MRVMEPPFLECYGYTWIHHSDGLYDGPRWPETDVSLLELEDLGRLGHTSIRQEAYRYILRYPVEAPSA
jgi:hypothetical protein